MKKFAIIIQVFNPRVHPYSMKEMRGLAESAGYKICGTVIQNLTKINPKYFLGQGKVDILQQYIQGFFHPDKEEDEGKGLRPQFGFEHFGEDDLLDHDNDNVSDNGNDNDYNISEDTHDAAVEGILVYEGPTIPNDEILSETETLIGNDPARDDSELVDFDDTDLNIVFPDNLSHLSELIIIFNNRLSHSQITTLSRELAVVVKDRDEIVLEIFEQNARTHESSLQIELARMALQTNIMKKDFGGHVKEKQGRDFKGKGIKGWEPQMLAYRRRKKKIQDDLNKIANQRNQRRKQRSKMFNVGVVGYTNAGKSTLINTLAGTTLETANHEFTTTSPVSRKVTFPNFDEYGGWAGHEVIMTDSVGFIMDMSRVLFDAFLSTLEELQFSDLLLILIDFSDNLKEIGIKIETSLSVLSRVNSIDLPKIFGLNKMDLIPKEAREEKFRKLCYLYPDFKWYMISGKDKSSLKTLSDAIVSSKLAHFSFR
ncbi:MAG: GTPase [Promethearchaeota archaeon]